MQRLRLLKFRRLTSLSNFNFNGVFCYSEGVGRGAAERWTKQLLQVSHSLGVKHLQVDFILCSEHRMKVLNWYYRDVKKSTDVLALEYGFNKESGYVCGEIVVCVSVAKRQAKLYRHTLTKEVRVLATHGLLHLMGYDHLTRRDRQVMAKMEQRVLKEFNSKGLIHRG